MHSVLPVALWSSSAASQVGAPPLAPLAKYSCCISSCGDSGSPLLLPNVLRVLPDRHKCSVDHPGRAPGYLVELGLPVSNTLSLVYQFTTEDIAHCWEQSSNHPDWHSLSFSLQAHTSPRTSSVHGVAGLGPCPYPTMRTLLLQNKRRRRRRREKTHVFQRLRADQMEMRRERDSTSVPASLAD